MIYQDAPVRTSSIPSLTHSDEQSCSITDAGCYRQLNEDRFASLDCALGKAWIVCDGMGGVEGGEFAAQLAINAITNSLTACSPSTTLPKALIDSLREANRSVALRRQGEGFRTMGTTAVVVLINNQEVSIAHAGDSRAYIVSGTRIRQLTIDHTFVQDLVDLGSITSEEALRHPQAHVLTKCIGASSSVEVDISTYWIQSTQSTKNYLVLATDGLYSLVRDEEIALQLSTSTPQTASSILVDLAKSRGGYDNITLSIIRLTGTLIDGQSIAPPQEQLADSSITSGFLKKLKTVVIAYSAVGTFIGLSWVILSLFSIAAACLCLIYLSKI